MTLNAFPKYQEIKTDLTEKIGRLKTVTFIILYSLTLGIIIYYYSQETLTKQVEINNPTRSEYESVNLLSYIPKFYIFHNIQNIINLIFNSHNTDSKAQTRL